ncbi:hypothetical protein D3C81_2004630 [compost metagenome]
MVAEGNRAHQQIFFHAHVREDPPPFRGLGNAATGHKMRRPLADIRPLKQDLSTADARLAKD